MQFTKVLKILYISGVIAALSIPVGFMKYYKPVNAENRELSELPEKISESFGKELDSYLEDNFAFRDRLVTADSIIKAKVFKMSGSEKVVSGKDGWLFFAEDIDDLTSKNTMSKREIGCIKRELELINEYASKHNSRFLFIIAPNKASLYDRFLPYYYVKSGIPNNKSLLENSILSSVEYMDLSALFESGNEVLYHRLDSHWNNKGALFVIKALTDKFGLPSKDYETPTITSDWNGDLYKMLYPLGEEKDEQYNYSGFEYSYTKRFKSVDDMVISTKNEHTNNGSLLMFRDSFGRSILPFAADNFSEAELRRAVPYDLDRLTQKHFDYTVLEIVERNLDELLAQAPHLTAEETSIPNSNAQLDKEDYDFTVEYSENECHIYGVINKTLSENTRIYVKVNGKAYEAFPCYEKEKKKYDYSDGNGFSLYISTTASINETEIYIYIGGGLTNET